MSKGVGPQRQKPLQRTASRLLSTLTTYSPDDDQEMALMDELRGRQTRRVTLSDDQSGRKDVDQVRPHLCLSGRRVSSLPVNKFQTYTAASADPAARKEPSGLNRHRGSVSNVSNVSILWARKAGPCMRAWHMSK